MYFLMCFLVRVFGTITGKITTEYLTPGYYRPVTGVIVENKKGCRPDSFIYNKDAVSPPIQD